MKKVVLITGISSGLGKSVASYLAQKDLIVYGTGRKELTVESGIKFLRMDVTNQESIKNVVSTVINNEGQLDVLINNAGMGISGAVEDSSPEEIRLQMDTNFIGMISVIKETLPFMRKKNTGTIINISSIGGLMGLPFQGIYSASKFAVEGFTDALRMELKQFNIKVILIEPGDFNTNFTDNRKIVALANNDSPYKEQFSKTLSLIEKDERSGLPPTILAKKLYHILDKKNPAPRYVISTFEQQLAVILKYFLPDRWFYKIIESHYGIK